MTMHAIAVVALILAVSAQIGSTKTVTKKLITEAVTIFCSVGNSTEGLNSKEIFWKHRGISVSIDGVRLRKPSKYELMINDLKYDDSGEYSCFDGNTTIGTTELIVEGKPSFTKIFTRQTIIEGAKLTITCAASSVPIASIRWEKDDKPLLESAGLQSISTNIRGNTIESSVLNQSASILHNGTYTCIAANKLGTVKHQAAILVYVRAYINKPLKKQHIAREGTNLTLTCSAYGYPVPSLFWDKELNNISETSHFHIEKRTNGLTIQSSLVINRIKTGDSGNYTCFAANPFSPMKTSVTLVTVQGLPICCQLSETKIGSRSTTITWKATSDGNSNILQYIVKIRDVLSATTNTFFASSQNSTIKLINLNPNRAYDIELKAENSIGFSNGSSISIKTLKERYEMCLKLLVKHIAKNMATVQWNLNCSATWPSTLLYVDVIVLRNNSVIMLTTSRRYSRNRTAHITGLVPFSEYQVRVRTVPEESSVGWKSGLFRFSTAQAAPGPPRDLKANGKSLTSIELSWNAPIELNGIINMYAVKYAYSERYSLAVGFNEKLINAVLHPKRYVVLENLLANTLYNITVRERTGPGMWSEAISATAKTKQGVPTTSPRNVSIRLKNNSTVMLKWDRLSKDDVSGDLLGYFVIVTDMQGVTVFNQTVSSNQSEIEIGMLQPSLQYNFKIFGFTRAGSGKEVTYRFFTADGVPSVPRAFEAVAVDSRSIKLTWMRPKTTNGAITSSEIKWRKIKNKAGKVRRSVENDEEQSIEIPIARDTRITREYYMKNLSPYSTYSFRVRERTTKGWGPFTDIVRKTTKEDVSTAPGDLKVVSKTSSSITISWSYPEEPNGLVRVFTVQCWQMMTLKSHMNISASISVAHYKATCSNLKSSTDSKIKVFAVSSLKGMVGALTAKTAELSGGFPWIPLIGGCVGFVVVVALLVTTLLLCRRRPKYEEVDETLDEIEMNGTVKSRPIHISNLKQYVLHNHTNSDHGFFTEYESIKPTANLTWEHSQEPCNHHKNRYSNIVAYDHTRVILNPIDSQQGSTYINANYVDGYKHPRKFIATQGPLPDTVNDFWRMIYEQNSHVIIMLTRIIESNRVKCEQYWPDHGSMQYGEIIVTLVDSTELSDYVVRTFCINSTDDVDYPGQEVKQYHYLGWPDHGVPEYPTSMVTFTKSVMDSVPPKPGPIVVHCSAGVGRTGTLIVIDAMLNQIRDESIIDVYWFISHIRKQRNCMVQTEAQYVFIYDGLLDAVICGNTEVFAKDISKKCRNLNQQSPDTGDTYLRQEFKRLEAGLSSQEKELFSVANLLENKEKNRFVNILPFNRNRVKLAYIYGIKGSDYINASYVDGYRQRHAYISTQAPLESTVNDFWRMIWEQNCHNIVMLTKLKEKGQERCYEYWPSCGSETFGKFLVDNLSEIEDESGHTSKQELNLTYSETGRSRRVSHYMFTGWPDYGSPNSGGEIIKLVNLVQDLTSIRGCGPIVVHCSGGAGRTGTFIALCIGTQKLKEGDSVDVFQTVRQLRTQRPAMVQTIDQYFFIYQALKDYVDLTETIPNDVKFNETLETLA